jgi:hypothetical protein
VARPADRGCRGGRLAAAVGGRLDARCLRPVDVGAKLVITANRLPPGARAGAGCGARQSSGWHIGAQVAPR